MKLFPKNRNEFAWWALWCLGGTLLLSVLGYQGCVFQIPPIPVWQPQDHGWDPEENNFGWKPNPDAVQRVNKTLRWKSFGETAAGQSEEPLPSSAYLWNAYKTIFGKLPPTKDQGQIGSCVSFGTNNAVTRTLAVQIAVGHEQWEFKDIAEEVTYGGSRVQVGNGGLHGDGSVGAWAAKFVRDWGIVSREKHGIYDLTTYSVATCRAFGSGGCPTDLQIVARQNPVKAIVKVTTWAEAKKALASGYGIAVCSNQGFSMHRDPRGVCAAQGHWGHCMCLDGFYTDSDGHEYGHIENSWGPSAFTGPTGWGSPSTAGFWADSRTVGSMLAAGDSWAFSSVTGFPARKIDWFVFQPLKKESDNAILAIFDTRIGDRGPVGLPRRKLARR